MNWHNIRIVVVSCNILSVLTNIILIVIFRGLWKTLRDKAWLLIIAAYFLALINNIIVAYLFIFHVKMIYRGEIILLVTVFSIDQALKNLMWLIGFIFLRHYFSLVEATPDSVWREKLLDDLSESRKEKQNE